MRCFVTGCAGFIGSALTERLLSLGHSVVGYDNFSTGREQFLRNAQERRDFRLVRADLNDSAALAESMRDAELVFHLAANADVRFGVLHPAKDLEQNTLGTHQVLQAMRESRVGRIAFASSGSVYGEAATFPTPEDAPFPVQTSFYGASKAAGEGLIAAYCSAYGFTAYIFRFVSILGERYSHGHVRDFYAQLQETPGRLRVLGDGRQRKSYLYVEDCIDAMLLVVERARGAVNIFNLGHDTYCEVTDSIGWICEALGLEPQIEFAGGERGWVGDSPFIFLDTRKIRALGWAPRLGIRESVLCTLAYLTANPWVLEAPR